MIYLIVFNVLVLTWLHMFLGCYPIFMTHDLQDVLLMSLNIFCLKVLQRIDSLLRHERL